MFDSRFKYTEISLDVEKCRIRRRSNLKKHIPEFKKDLDTQRREVGIFDAFYTFRSREN